LISRTGYTGEDGFEIFLFGNSSEEAVLELWEMILEVGKEFGIEPCGLVARDTLRLEAGFCLYGNELSEHITPLESGLNFGVFFDDRNFIGKFALLKQKNECIRNRLIGLKMVERGVPRKGMTIFKGERKIGFITSGTFSPILRQGIALGNVTPDQVSLGKLVNVCIREKLVRARVVSLPFYDENKYGWKRSG